MARIRTFSASSYCFFSVSGPGIVLRSANPNTRSIADKIRRSAFNLPILGSSVLIMFPLKLLRACTNPGCRDWLAPRFCRLDSKTPSTIFSRPSSSGTVLSVAKPRPRLMTDMATASAADVRFFSCSVTVVLKFVICLTSSGATAGLSGGAGFACTVGCADRAPADPL